MSVLFSPLELGSSSLQIESWSRQCANTLLKMAKRLRGT